LLIYAIGSMDISSKLWQAYFRIRKVLIGSIEESHMIQSNSNPVFTQEQYDYHILALTS